MDGCRGLAAASVGTAKEEWAAAGVDTCLSSDVPAAVAGSR